MDHREEIYQDCYVFFLNEDKKSYCIYLSDSLDIDIPGNLKLPDSIDGLPVTRIGEYAFQYSDCSTISIPSSVTSIDECAFLACDKLKSINIPNGVKFIDEGAFMDCYSLEGIIIHNSVISIGDKSFSCCESLKSIELSNNLKTIGDGTFSKCISLESIYIPKNVEDIQECAFYGCNKLHSINVDKNNKKYDSRDNCNAIIETQENELIVGCKNTIIPKSVVSIGEYAFNLSDSTIHIPDNVKIIKRDAFARNTELKSILIPKNVKSIGLMVFNYCDDLSEIIVDKDNKWYDSRGNCNAIIETKTNKLIAGCKNTVIPDGIVSIGDSAFYGCMALKHLIIPNSVESIESCAFFNCRSLEWIILPKNLKHIGHSIFSGSEETNLFYEGDDKYLFDNYVDTCINAERVYYYSEKQPKKRENYWHYVNGLPEIWK